MTLNQIAYNILNVIRGGRSNNDDHISLDQIKFNIKYYRAMLIRRDLARNNFMSRHIEQDLKCLRLIPVDANKCCASYGLDIRPVDRVNAYNSSEHTTDNTSGDQTNVGNQISTGNSPTFDGSDCILMRTEMKIPRTVRANFKELITFVGAVDGLERIPLIDSNRIKYIGYDKYTKDVKKAFFIEDYLYVYNANEMELINVRGVFEDPEVLKYFDCDGSECYDDDSLFPMPADMIDAITAGLLNGTMLMISTIPSDTELDRMQDMPRTQQQS